MRLLFILCSFVALVSAQTSNLTFLAATALATNAENHTAIECWEFTTPISISTDAGTIGAANLVLSNATEAVYTVIPPRTDGGLHKAPAPQFVIFLSGLIHITLPVAVTGNTTSDQAYLIGGANGLIFAADTTGAGHYTSYPGDQPTVSLQLRPRSGLIPGHTVLHPGPCHYAGDAGQTSNYVLGV